MVRESMRVMPSITQPLWTWITAKPLPEELENVRPLTPFFHIWLSTALIAAGVGISAYSFMFLNNFFLLAIGFIVASGGLKQMQVMICHNCSHDMIFKSRRANTVLGTVISGFFLLKPFYVYKKEHLLRTLSVINGFYVEILKTLLVEELMVQ